MKWKKLSRSFYLRPTLTVAKELPGRLLLRKVGRAVLIGRIVEVEAYLGENDPASHAYRGLTRRNEVMFHEGGYLYVYFTYGMHYCCNVVTEEKGKGRAILIRAVEPIAGIELMTRRRAGSSATPPAERTRLLRWLCSGPARMCQAFGIGRQENGTDLCGGKIWLGEEVGAPATRPLTRTTRIGITAARERKWRFTIKGSPYTSR